MTSAENDMSFWRPLSVLDIADGSWVPSWVLDIGAGQLCWLVFGFGSLRPPVVQTLKQKERRLGFVKSRVLSACDDVI